MLLVTGCGAANKSSGLPNRSAMSGERLDRGAAITDSGHSQTNEATVGPAGAQIALDVAQSTQNKTSNQTETAISASPTNSLSLATTSRADQVSASAQPSVSGVSGVSQQPVAAQPTDPAKNTATIAINCQTAVGKGLAQQEKFQ